MASGTIYSLHHPPKRGPVCRRGGENCVGPDPLMWMSQRLPSVPRTSAEQHRLGDAELGHEASETHARHRPGLMAS